MIFIYVSGSVHMSVYEQGVCLIEWAFESATVRCAPNESLFYEAKRKQKKKMEREESTANVELEFIADFLKEEQNEC